MSEVNEFANELSSWNTEAMPSDTLGSAKQEGNGSSALPVSNGMWFVYSPHLISLVLLSVLSRDETPTMAQRNVKFLSQYQISRQRRMWLEA